MYQTITLSAPTATAGLSVTLPAETLRRALTLANRAVSNRSTLPILHHVLLEAAADGTLRLQATDIEVGLTVALPAEVQAAGRTTLAAHLLAELVATYTPAWRPIQIGADERDEVTLLCGRSRVGLYGLPADEFPVVPSRTEAEPFATLGADVLRAALARVLPAASTDETRLGLCSVQVLAEGDRLRLVATDTFRLATCTVPNRAADPPAEGASFLLPTRAAAELVQLLPAGGEVSLYLAPSSEQVWCELATADGLAVTLVSRTRSGSFPDWRAVVAQTERTCAVQLDGAEARRQLRCSQIVREGSRGADVVLAATALNGASGVTLTTGNRRVGRMVGDLEAEEVQGTERHAAVDAFDGRLLRETLAACGDELTAALAGDGSPGVFRGEGDFLTVVMPRG